MPNQMKRNDMRQVSPTGPRAFGAPLGAPPILSDSTGRPKPGAAPPDVQRRAIAAHQAEAARQARAGLYQRQQQAVAPTTSSPPLSTSGTNPDNPTRDLAVGTAAQRITQHPGQVNQTIDELSR